MSKRTYREQLEIAKRVPPPTLSFSNSDVGDLKLKPLEAQSREGRGELAQSAPFVL